METDVGRERQNNEDTARVLPELGLFVVADGMGGHVAGEIASRVAAENFINVVRERGTSRLIRDEATILGEAIIAANRAVIREAEAQQLLGMGTTLTAVRIRSRTTTVAHVGDTRAGFLIEGKLRPLTKDQTVVALMIESGTLSAEDAHDHPEKHMLTQAIGTQNEVEPEIVQERIPRGARIIMSSDGLHDAVPESELIELASNLDIDTAARDLIRLANEHGGPDNITVILIDP